MVSGLEVESQGRQSAFSAVHAGELISRCPVNISVVGSSKIVSKLIWCRMSSGSMLDKFTSAELRQKLLEHGVDIPVSVNKDFMVKKLKSIEAKKVSLSSQGGRVKKVSVAPRRKSPSPPIQRRSSPQSSNRSSTPSNSSEEESSRRNKRRLSPEPKRKRATSIKQREDEVDGRLSSSRGQRQPPPPSPSSFRPLTRASTGRVVKQEPSWSPPQTPRSATRVKTETGRGDYEDSTRAPAPQSTFHQQESEQYRSQFSPIVAPNQGNVARGVVIPSPKSNMFGVVVPGRMVSTDFIANQPVGATKFQLELKEADKVDHVVIFLTGNEPFPPGSGGQIFFGWTNPMNNNSVDTWNKLGFITNEKPSVIYKISELRNFVLHQAVMQGNPQESFPFHTAELGISIEPLELILKSISPQLEL